MNEEEKYNLIERYLEGTLQGAELSVFKKQLKEDKMLQSEVELHQQVAATLKGEKIHEFRKVLKAVDDKWQVPIKKEKKIFKLNFARIVTIAAAILLLTVAYQFLMPKQSASSATLFASNFEPYQMILNQRSIDAEQANQALLSEAITSYGNKNFKKSAIDFELLSVQEPTIIAFPFYAGLAHLSAGHSDEAIDVFEEILKQTGHLFLEQSRWYLALAYLQKEDHVKAKDELQKIEKGNYNYKAAQTLLRNI